MFTRKTLQPVFSTESGQGKEGLNNHQSLLLSLLSLVEDRQERVFSCIIKLVSHGPF